MVFFRLRQACITRPLGSGADKSCRACLASIMRIVALGSLKQTDLTCKFSITLLDVLSLICDTQTPVHRHTCGPRSNPQQRSSAHASSPTVRSSAISTSAAFSPGRVPARKKVMSVGGTQPLSQRIRGPAKPWWIIKRVRDTQWGHGMQRP